MLPTKWSLMPFSQYEVEGQFKDNVGRGEEKIVRRYRMERVRQNGEIGGERQNGETERKKERGRNIVPCKGAYTLSQQIPSGQCAVE